MGSEKEYLIDIASESKYSGQTEQYREAYTEWRTRPKNRFGYKYVKDTREHTYSFGEGFETELASDSERSSLKYCSCIIGGSLLISAIIRFCQVLFDNRTGHLLSGSSIEVYGNTHPTDNQAMILLSLFKPFSLIVCIIFMALFTKLPRKVALPKGENIPTKHTVCLFAVLSGFAVACYAASLLFRVLWGSQYMSVPGGFVWCNDMNINIHCFSTQYIITPILHAILMNGFILQLLRQYGDSTAIILTATAESIMAINLANIGTHFVLGITFAIITIKTGSIINAMIGRMLVNFIFFALKLIDTTYTANEGELYLLLFCIVVLGIALFCLGKLISYDDYKLNIKSADTELEFPDKLKVFFTAMPTISWLAASIIVWLYIVMS